MAEKEETGLVGQKEEGDITHLEQRLDMLDQRLDNIDSVVTAVVERVMKQPIALVMTCPHCGKRTEIAVIGNEKPTE